MYCLSELERRDTVLLTILEPFCNMVCVLFENLGREKDTDSDFEIAVLNNNHRSSSGNLSCHFEFRMDSQPKRGFVEANQRG